MGSLCTSLAANLLVPQPLTKLVWPGPPLTKLEVLGNLAPVVLHRLWYLVSHTLFAKGMN